MVSTMKLTRETQTKVVMDALKDANGDRVVAAETLEVSERTLNRYIKDLNLYPYIDRMGWLLNNGPPRSNEGGSTVRARMLSYIRRHRGVVDYEKMTLEIYGSDGRAWRQRIYSALDQMKAAGIVKNDNDRWIVV